MRDVRRFFSTAFPVISELGKRPLVSISNNSFYYYLLNQAHPDYRPHWQPKVTELKQCTIVSPPFWLDTLHPSFHQYDWGHNILELPRAARMIAAFLYPNYPRSKPITWEMYLNIRQKALESIHEIPNVRLIKATPLPISHAASNHYILPFASGGNLHLPIDTLFCNWWRQPAMHGLQDIAERSYLELYSTHPDEAPETVIVLGSGLAVLWLAKHFPKTQFIVLKRRHDQLPETPRIRLKDLPNLTTHNTEDVQFSHISDTKLIVKNIQTGAEFLGDFYKAIGFRTYPDTLKIIPEKSKLELNSGIVGKWNAPKVLPEGALLESLLRWHNLAQTLDWVFEPLAYHDDAGFPQVISAEMRKIGIELNVEFFNALSEIVNNLEDFSSASDVQEIFIEAFDAQKPTDIEKKHFRETLGGLLKKYLSDSSLGTNTSEFWKYKDPIGKRSYSTSASPESKQQDQQMNKINQLLKEWWYWSPEGDIRNFERNRSEPKFRDGSELSKSLEQTPDLHKFSKY